MDPFFFRNRSLSLISYIENGTGSHIPGGPNFVTLQPKSINVSVSSERVSDEVFLLELKGMDTL